MMHHKEVVMPNPYIDPVTKKFTKKPAKVKTEAAPVQPVQTNQEPAQDTPETRRLTCQIPIDLFKKLRHHATDLDKSVTETLVLILAEKLG